MVPGEDEPEASKETVVRDGWVNVKAAVGREALTVTVTTLL